jgi:predicted CXXCH cytochrome family protein
LFAIVAAGSPTFAQEEAGPRFIRPTSDSLVAAGWIEIAAVVPDGASSLTLTLDGRPLATKNVTLPSNGNSGSGATSMSLMIQIGVRELEAGVRFSPAWVAVREVTPGNHELKLGPASVRFRAHDPAVVDKATSEALQATSTTLYVAHPKAMVGMVTCPSCHEMKRDAQPPRFEDMSALSPQVPEVCFRCHDQARFLPTHAHRVEHLAFCQMCHDPHGANRLKLMKMPRQEVCKKCHE